MLQAKESSLSHKTILAKLEISSVWRWKGNDMLLENISQQNQIVQPNNCEETNFNGAFYIAASPYLSAHSLNTIRIVIDRC